MTGSRFLHQKPGYQQTQVAAPRSAPTAAKAVLSKFAGVIAHHTPTLSRVVAKVAAHVHLPHLHVSHALLELPGQLWRKALHKDKPPESSTPPPPAKPLKQRFNKPSGPK